MAISVAYGIAYATFMTLFLLPLLLAVKNSFKVGVSWLWTGRKPERESVERAIMEMKREEERKSASSPTNLLPSQRAQICAHLNRCDGFRQFLTCTAVFNLVKILATDPV